MHIGQKKLKFLRIASHIQRFFCQNWQFIIGILLLNYLTVAWSLWENRQIEVMVFYSFGLFLGTVTMTGLLQLLYNPVLKKICKIGLMFSSAIFFSLESFAIYNYKALIGAGIINALLETNFQEAVEFIKMYIGLRGISSILVAVIIAIYCYFVAAILQPKSNQNQSTTAK